jgi:hypothetical protein
LTCWRRLRRTRCSVATPSQRDDGSDNEEQQHDAAKAWAVGPEAPGQHRGDDKYANDDCGSDAERSVVTEEALAHRVGMTVVGDEEPAGEVEQQATPAEDGQHDEGHAHQDRIDPEATGDASCDAAQDFVVAGCPS